ncbi:MAG: hypothetical protein ABSE80_13310, partial [Halobacteriota archaeon]
MGFHSELWDFIGVAMEGLSYAVANCLANCFGTLGLEPCRCYGKAMVYHSGEDQSLGNCIAFAWMLLIVKYIEQIPGMAWEMHSGY